MKKERKQLKDRIKEAMEERGIKIPQLAKETKIPKDRIYKWYQDDTNPKYEDALVLENWLSSQKIDKTPQDTSISENPQAADVQKKYNRFDSKLNARPEGIPIFEDAPFTLSNVESYNDSITDKPDFWVTIPGLRKCNYGCRATGDSMHPLIRNHALVVGEELEDISFILFGEIYIIQTRNNIETVKYIHPHERDDAVVLLVPYNKTAQSTPIPKKDILRLFRARAVFNVL